MNDHGTYWGHATEPEKPTAPELTLQEHAGHVRAAMDDLQRGLVAAGVAKEEAYRRSRSVPGRIRVESKVGGVEVAIMDPERGPLQRDAGLERLAFELAREVRLEAEHGPHPGDQLVARLVAGGMPAAGAAVYRSRAEFGGDGSVVVRSAGGEALEGPAAIDVEARRILAAAHSRRQLEETRKHVQEHPDGAYRL